MRNVIFVNTVLLLTRAWFVAPFQVHATPRCMQRTASSGTCVILLSTSPSEPPKSPDEDSATQKPFRNEEEAPLDPLFVAVTRVDDDTASAKTLSVPLFGELALDKSLFIFLPVAAFALGGLVLSVAVLMNSADDFASAIQETAATVPSTGVEGCRGICSDPNNLEGLDQFMSGISGR